MFKKKHFHRCHVYSFTMSALWTRLQYILSFSLSSSSVPLWCNKGNLIVGIVSFKLKVMGDDSPATGREEQARPDHRHPAGRRHPHGHQSAGLNDNVVFFFSTVRCVRVLLPPQI